MTQVRETVSFKAGDVILYPGVPGPRDRAYRVLEGLVRLEAVDEEENALTLRLVRPGGFFGEEALFGQERIYFAEAATDVRLEPGPMVVLAGSGMLTGGRILHHLKHGLSDPRNALVFVGYHPRGGLGAEIIARPPAVRILGEEVPLRASVHTLGRFPDGHHRLRILQGGEVPGVLVQVGCPDHPAHHLGVARLR